MGTILIARDEQYNPAEGKVSIEKLHFNFWALPALLGTLYFIDIGSLFKNESNQDFSTFDVGIPALINDDPARPDAQCLVSLIGRNEAAWNVIFRNIKGIADGKPGDFFDYSMQRSSGEQLRMTTVGLKRQGKALKEFCVWKVTLTRPLPSGNSTYVRLRFRFRRWPLRNPKTRILLRTPASTIYDLRINEVREQIDPIHPASHPIKRLFDRAIPIYEVHAFLSVPVGVRIHNLFPTPTYVRVTEEQIWQQYLKRSAARQPKLLSVYWQERPKEGTEVKEVRIFADIERPRNRLPWVVAGVVATLLYFIYIPESGMLTLMAWIVGTVRAHLISLISLGAIAAIVTLAHLFPRIRRLTAQGLSWLDARFYDIR